jgi:hypothetical protein
LAVVLAAVFVAVLGCRRKPAQAAAASAPSGGSFASYAGTWKGYMTKTAETAACKAETDGTLLGPEVVIVTGTGAFSGATGDYSGVISRSGQVTGTFTDGDVCGDGPWTGTCLSHSLCSGTFVSYGASQDRTVQGESGTWVMTR